MKNLLLTPRLPEGRFGTLLVHTMGASVFFVFTGRFLTSSMGLLPEGAALTIFGTVLLLAWLGKFPIAAAVGMGLGAGLLALGSIYINLNHQDTILPMEALTLSIGLALFIRGLAVGPHPLGWRMPDDEEYGGGMTGI